MRLALVMLFALSPAFAQDKAVDELKMSRDARAEAAPEAHGHAMHGAAALASADDCKQAGAFVDSVDAKQQGLINGVVANRGHRVQHALWHATRSGLSDKELSQIVGAYGGGWSGAHSFCPPPKPDAAAPDYNPVGEDFLYMHRNMIGSVRAALLGGRQRCVSGFKGIPDPASWPLPDGDASGPKSPETLAQLKAWDAKLEDPAWLASVSLSQLGMAIELSVHNNLHMRYATTRPPKGFEAAEESGGAPLPFDGKFPADWRYDDPAYNWLADPYSAALNPTFWKIHGYVDALIDKWLKAHGYDKIAESCAGAPRCYQWKGTWSGVMPSYSDAPPDNRMRAGKPGQKPELDPRTKRFNEERMRRAQLGVIGGPRVGAPRDRAPMPGGPPPAPPSNDPFDYAAAQACGGK